jgi:5-oxoprolinase (ATP-hydrolysing)
MQTCRIGIDIGGTFTDFALLSGSNQQLRVHKRLTTPEDPAIGALSGLRELTEAAGITLRDVEEIVHGTTLVTNAIIERRGAPLGLITTCGFRDVLEHGSEQRYDIYDLFLRFPEPLVRRRHRFAVPERMSRDGRPITPLHEEAVAQAADALAADGVQAIAICSSTLTANQRTSSERRRSSGRATPA